MVASPSDICRCTHMRSAHEPDGVCYLCKHGDEKHCTRFISRYAVPPTEKQKAWRKAYDAKRRGAKKEYDAAREGDRKGRGARQRQDNAPRPIVGIDGEGQDTPHGTHVYTYLCAVNEVGTVVSETRFAPLGLTTDECAEMILRIPAKYLIFGYMFSYDITKIIEDMPLDKRYYLVHPEARKTRVCKACKHKFRLIRTTCPKCASPLVHEQHGTRRVRFHQNAFNFFNGKFSVYGKYDADEQRYKENRKVNDCFKFFGCSFVEAIKAWDVATPEQIEEISKMKGKRGAFDVEEPEDITRYCQSECQLLARMMRKLITAHKDADIPLRDYFGAGSTAGALLKKNNVDLYRGRSWCDDCQKEFSAVQRVCPDCGESKGVKIQEISAPDPSLVIAIMSAYFGGRFENSGIGFVDNLIYSNDIASAYPYALSFMPCLRCGHWDRDPTNSKLALHRFRVRRATKKERRGIAWMPLPCRTDEGSICYPTGFEGWAWDIELQSAIRGWPGWIETLESWHYHTDCDHKPFGFMPGVYRQRIAWGKEGRGIVLKLGANASYGKTAQIKGGGNARFRSWVWAGLTTATTRAMLNDAICSARDRWNVHAVATDGIYSSEELACPDPINTDTHGLKDGKTGEAKMPLGGWESKAIKAGGFFMKPGLYWRQDTSLKDIRARGLGRREAYQYKPKVEDAFLAWDRETIEPQVTVPSRRFFGVKQVVYMQSMCGRCPGVQWIGPIERGCPECGQVGMFARTRQHTNAQGIPLYGTWGIRPVKLAFDAHPKRVREKLKGGARYVRMCVRDMKGAVSIPYGGKTTPEGARSAALRDMVMEQPDYDEREFHEDDEV